MSLRELAAKIERSNELGRIKGASDAQYDEYDSLADARVKLQELSAELALFAADVLTALERMAEPCGDLDCDHRRPSARPRSGPTPPSTPHERPELAAGRATQRSPARRSPSARSASRARVQFSGSSAQPIQIRLDRWRVETPWWKRWFGQSEFRAYCKWRDEQEETDG